MQKHHTYGTEQTGDLVKWLYTDKKRSRNVQARLDEFLTGSAYREEASKVLFERWQHSYKQVYAPDKIETATEKMLSGIVRKCPDFPARPTQRIRLFSPALKIAAVLFLFLTAGSVAWLLQTNQGDRAVPTAMTNQDPVMIRIEAEQERHIELPDGTNIRLSAGATLEYDTNFPDERVVSLKGNAFFSVAKMEGKSFEVNYRDIIVRVLGTEFYLNEDTEKAEVILQSGSVEVLAGNRSIVLSPQQQLISGRDNEDFSVFELTETQMARMIRGKLTFHGTPLREAIVRTGEFFDTEIDVSTLTNSEPIRLEFGINDNLEDVLFILRTVSGNTFDYRIEGNIVITTPR